MRVWTAEENERLKALVAKNVSILKAAAALKRSSTSVRTQARKLGTPFPHMKDYRKRFKDSPDTQTGG
jgi:hypothetical protein